MSADSPVAVLYDASGNEKGVNANPVKVDPTGTTAQPVTDGGGSITIDATALPLPAGAATSAKQPALGTAGSPSTDVISVQGVSGGTPQPVSGPLTDTQLRATAVPVSAAALPLPSGAATSALQTTGNTSLGNIDTKTPALGQAAMAASVPVVIANNQSAVPISAAALPLPTGASTESTLSTMSGKLPATLGQKTMANSLPVVLASDQASIPVTGPLTDTQLRATPVPVSGSVTATGPLTDTQLRASAVPVTGPLTDTQLRASAVPVSAAALPLPSGAATSANQTTIGNQTTKINDGSNTAAVKAASTAAVATDPALVVAISPNNTPVLPTGAATSALQTTGNTSLGNIDTKTPALGQAAMAASTPVVLASNQSAVPVAGAKTNNNAAPGATNVGALAALANAANPSWTEGNLVLLSALLNGALRTDNTSWLGSAAPTVGQKTMANSIPMTMASDQSVPTYAANATTSGTIGTLGGTVSMATSGYAGCSVILSGTWVGTVVFEVSADGGTTWVATSFVSPSGSYATPVPDVVPSLSANGTYRGLGSPGSTNVRVRASAYTSGTINVTILSTAAPLQLMFTETAIVQDVIASVVNSSTANLAASASFTGTSESTLGVAGIQVNFKADQPCTIQMQQSPDGTNWDIVDSYSLAAATGDGRTFQATGSYYRIVVTNNGGSTTTYLRLQVALCPTVEALPRSLGQKTMANSLAVVLPSDQSIPLAGTLKPKYGTANQALTITLASLANAGARGCTAVDNTTSLYEDALFFVQATLAAAAVSATGHINIYGYGTVDGGTTYPEGFSGTDGAVTLSAPPNLVLLAQITANAINKVCQAGPFSFCRMYGVDRLPARWGLVLVNQSGAALTATAGNHFIKWQGVNGQLA